MKQVSKLRQMINEQNNVEPDLEPIPLLERDIIHYLRTETDRRRLAYWCEQYLKLDL